MSAGRGKRALAVTGLLCLFLVFLFLTTLKSHETVRATNTIHHATSKDVADQAILEADLTGRTIMPKLGNETAKAELGRAAWKLMHTTMARFPDEPTKDESAALKAYIHLFQRLYPCGECAEHFRKIINKYPPQVSSRSSAAAWACSVHNEVNKSLDKPLFNCANIGDFYDCGCADDEEADTKKSKDGTKPAAKGDKAKSTGPRKGFEKPEMSEESKERITGERGRDMDDMILPPVLIVEK